MKIVIAVAVGYMVFVSALYALQRRFMYVPGGPPEPPVEAGVPEMAAVEVTTSDGLTLLAWHAQAPDGRPTLIYFHGNAGNLAGRAFKARQFIDAGLGVLFVEYRGYGGNPGEPTEEGLYRDGRAAFEYLKGLGSGPASWVLYGESLGSAVATQMAHDLASAGTPAAGVILEAPFTSMLDMAQLRFPFVPTQRLVKDRFDSVSKIAVINAPLFIIHGLDDRTVPFRHGVQMFDAAEEPKSHLWVEGGGHVDLYDRGVGPDVIAFIEGVWDGSAVKKDNDKKFFPISGGS